MPEETRRVLHFINQHRGWVSFQKGGGLLFCELGLCRQIERDERIVGEKMPQCGSLARLTCTSKDKNRPRLGGVQQTAFDLAPNPHEHILPADNAKCMIQ